MRSNLFDRQPDNILGEILQRIDGRAYVVDPPREVIEDLIETAADHEGDLPELRLLVDGPTIRRVMEDFIVASTAADLVQDGVLDAKTIETTPGNTVVATEDSLLALVTVGGRAAGLTAAEDEFVGDAYESYAERWDEAEEFTLRTPSISEVRETLTEDMGEDTEDDFSGVLGSLETARGNGDGLDEVTISLLVAAKNDQLFYDVSRWGEETGVASKATFSRVKNDLEDSGLIQTEKVPVDVGRPRQRLTIQDERLEDASTSQIASVAQSVLN